MRSVFQIRVAALVWALAFAPALLAADKVGTCPGCPCEDCKCDAGKPCPVSLARAQANEDDGTIDLPFNAISFNHDGPTTFNWLIAQEAHTVIGEKFIAKGEDLHIVQGVTFSKPAKLFLKDKPATAAEVEAWASTTVDCRVKIGSGTLYFYGGKPAYNWHPNAVNVPLPQTIQQPQPVVLPQGGSSCPGGNCPNQSSSPFAPQRRR